MIDSFRRESLTTIAALALPAAVFFIGIYGPGNRLSGRVEEEIAQAEQSIRQIPLQVAELESLTDELRQRQDYLRDTAPLIPAGGDLHPVIRQVARLAAQFELKVARLEPLDPLDHESYRVLPFRISLTGRFRSIAAFLEELENHSRLYSVEELSLKRGDGRSGKATEADISFSAYVQNTESSGSDENNASSTHRRVDTGDR